MNYVDKNGVIVKKGDIIKYDEGTGYAKSLDEIIEFNGGLAAKMRIGEPKWSYIDDKPMSLKFFTILPDNDDYNKMTHAEVIGNIENSPELLTVKYAYEIWPV